MLGQIVWHPAPPPSIGVDTPIRRLFDAGYSWGVGRWNMESGGSKGGSRPTAHSLFLGHQSPASKPTEEHQAIILPFHLDHVAGGQLLPRYEAG